MLFQQQPSSGCVADTPLLGTWSQRKTGGPTSEAPLAPAVPLVTGHPENPQEPLGPQRSLPFPWALGLSLSKQPPSVFTQGVGINITVNLTQT